MENWVLYPQHLGGQKITLMRSIGEIISNKQGSKFIRSAIENFLPWYFVPISYRGGWIWRWRFFLLYHFLLLLREIFSPINNFVVNKVGEREGFKVHFLLYNPLLQDNCNNQGKILQSPNVHIDPSIEMSKFI